MRKFGKFDPSCRKAAGFTLIELLVVISIMAILAGMIVTGVGVVRRRAMVAKALSNIESIKVAISAYNTLTGVYPHLSTTPQDQPEALFRALYSANPMSGGTAQNHLEDWRVDSIGRWTGPNGDVNHHWDNPTEEQLLTISKSYIPCAFLDPWGRPYHYVEWDSIPVDQRRLGGGALKAPGAAPYSIWSDGPDRTNQFGAQGEDDVTSWSS